MPMTQLEGLQSAVSNAVACKQNKNDAQDDMVHAIVHMDVDHLAAAAVNYRKATEIFENISEYDELFEQIRDKYEKHPDCSGARLIKLFTSWALEIENLLQSNKTKSQDDPLTQMCLASNQF